MVYKSFYFGKKETTTKENDHCKVVIFMFRKRKMLKNSVKVIKLYMRINISDKMTDI